MLIRPNRKSTHTCKLTKMKKVKFAFRFLYAMSELDEQYAATSPVAMAWLRAYKKEHEVPSQKFLPWALALSFTKVTLKMVRQGLKVPDMNLGQLEMWLVARIRDIQQKKWNMPYSYEDQLHDLLAYVRQVKILDSSFFLDVYANEELSDLPHPPEALLKPLCKANNLKKGWPSFHPVWPD